MSTDNVEKLVSLVIYVNGLLIFLVFIYLFYYLLQKIITDAVYIFIKRLPIYKYNIHINLNKVRKDKKQNHTNFIVDKN